MPAAITAAFLQSNPRLRPDSIVATCSTQEAPRLREVHVCFDRQLQPRACSADALRQAVADSVPPAMRELNLRAFDKGFEYGGLLMQKLAQEGEPEGILSLDQEVEA